ncbi:MAG TPA: T9SS type A sorting domain-containing protein, partial [Ignavibacteriaceae bacterium]|nr:T9SS type A sorting domain-containing protein [Ignavibacteriaceae bacterium]
TTIDYSIKDDGFVSLKVYNLLGQLVADLVDREQKSGFHTMDFNASNLPSGIYIYTLRTSELTLVKKMLLLK